MSLLPPPQPLLLLPPPPQQQKQKQIAGHIAGRSPQLPSCDKVAYGLMH
jgi:hypothetical protein